MAKYEKVEDIPLTTKMLTGGLAGSWAEILTIPIDTAVIYL